MRIFGAIWITFAVCAALSLSAAPQKRKTPAKKSASSTQVRKTAPKSTTARKSTPARRRTAVARRRVPSTPRPTPVVRAAASSSVSNWLNVPGLMENPAALVPFFEQLYRLEQGDAKQVLRVFHYGDSHTAADEWSGTLRYLLQARFGDGGSGFSHAGRPWNGYRRLDLKSYSTNGWYSDGLNGRSGDGVYGIAGVSMSTERSGEMVNLQADCEHAEFHFLRQPGGGRIELSDNGVHLETVDTDGDAMPASLKLNLTPGSHLLTARTLDRKPVRIHGWVTENTAGITWEMMGINGAQASIAHKWNDVALAEPFQNHSPALIVLAYGTNEARNKDWTYESYRDMFAGLIDKFRKLAPVASILVIGPPDHMIRTRAGYVPVEKIDLILEAQRDASASRGAAFWDLRERMGGKGAMRSWVHAGMAQGDFVHFTAPGYRLLGAALYKELMGQFSAFGRVRREALEPKSAEAAFNAVASPGDSRTAEKADNGQAFANP